MRVYLYQGPQNIGWCMGWRRAVSIVRELAHLDGVQTISSPYKTGKQVAYHNGIFSCVAELY